MLGGKHFHFFGFRGQRAGPRGKGRIDEARAALPGAPLRLVREVRETTGIRSPENAFIHWILVATHS